MKIQNIPKIIPKIELTSPTLLHCKSGECGGCPNNTGKLLWIPKTFVNLDGTTGSPIFNFQYNFFNKSAESESSIKYNMFDYSIFYNSQQQGSYSHPPDRNWAITNDIYDNYVLSPSVMRGSNVLEGIGFPMNSNGDGGWLFFRQPNPAISNVHDALCFEYNHEKRLITFRSF